MDRLTRHAELLGDPGSTTAGLDQFECGLAPPLRGLGNLRREHRQICMRGFEFGQRTGIAHADHLRLKKRTNGAFPLDHGFLPA